MGALMGKQVPYNEREDIEKLESQWNKRAGHSQRRDYSAAIVRCATAAEIAANIAIKSEFILHGTFTDKQVESFLVWANGLDGKMRRLILPLKYKNDGSNQEYKRLLVLAQEINSERNAIVHRGEFRSQKIEQEIETKSREFIETLVSLYKDQYQLPLEE
jgi:hypothetical protein